LKKKYIILVGSDEPMDSSNRFIYDLDKQWKVPESKTYKSSELTDEIMHNHNNFFVFFNDTHGTGNQFVKTFKKQIDKIGASNCGIVSLVMTDLALENFRDNFGSDILIEPSFQSTKSIDKYQDEGLFDTKDISSLAELGTKVYKKGVLGYKDTGLLVAYLHQCPNNTLPIIWADGENNIVDGQSFPWKPLFPYIKVKEPEDIQNTIDDTKIAIKPTKNAIFKVPFESKNKGAIGLEEKLQEVHTALQNPQLHKANIGQVATFQGMGGLGKTQLAVEYSHRYKDVYDGVVWLTVDQDIESQLMDLAVEQGWVSEGLDGKLKLAKAKSGYDALENTLLVYDNVENYDTEVKALIPKSNANKILITSRNTIGGFTSIELTTMDEDNALALLEYESNRAVKEDEKEAIEALIKELDGLPLALEMAGAYMADADLSWGDYWELFKAQKVSFLEKSTIRGSGTNHENNISRTLAIGESILSENPLLEKIIYLLSFGASEPMNKTLLAKMLGVKEFNIAEAIQHGTKLKFIKKEEEGKNTLYTLHRLVREVWKSQREIESSFAQDTVGHLIGYLKKIKDEYLNLSMLEMASFHAKAWAEHSEEKDDKALLLSYAAFPYYYSGAYTEALQLVNDAYILVDKKKDSPAHAEVLTYKATLQDNLGDAKEAKPYYEESLAMRKRLYEGDHPDVESSLNNMGFILGTLGDAKEAKLYYEESLAMCKRLYEGDHPNVAGSLNNVGSIAFKFKECHKAQKLLEEAESMIERLGYDKHNLRGKISTYLKRIKKSMKDEAKLNFKKKGRFCVDG